MKRLSNIILAIPMALGLQAVQASDRAEQAASDTKTRAAFLAHYNETVDYLMTMSTIGINNQTLGICDFFQISHDLAVNLEANLDYKVPSSVRASSAEKARYQQIERTAQKNWNRVEEFYSSGEAATVGCEPIQFQIGSPYIERAFFGYRAVANLIDLARLNEPEPNVFLAKKAVIFREALAPLSRVAEMRSFIDQQPAPINNGPSFGDQLASNANDLEVATIPNDIVIKHKEREDANPGIPGYKQGHCCEKGSSDPTNPTGDSCVDGDDDDQCKAYGRGIAKSCTDRSTSC